MKKIKTLLLITLILIMTASAVSALASGTPPFSFRNGVCFGMSAQEIIQLEAANSQVEQDAWDTTDMSGQAPGLSLLMAQTMVKVSTYDATLGYFLSNDRMQGAAYDFPICTDDMYQDLTAALSAVYGDSQRLSFDVLVQDLQRLVPSVYDNAPSGYGVRAWQLENVTIYLFYYDDDMFGILYLNPDLDSSPAVDTTGV